MVVFKPESFKLRFPTKLIRATIQDGRMIRGTDFMYDELTFEPISEQMFFCPDKKAGNRCLSQQTFEGNDQLQCSSEATPDIEWDKIGNRNDEKGSFYSCVYQVSLQKLRIIQLSGYLGRYLIQKSQHQYVKLV